VKWLDSPELREEASKFRVVFLLNCKLGHFANAIDVFIEKRLLCFSPPPDWVYSCLLQLLRGRWFLDCHKNARAYIQGNLSVHDSYRQTTRPLRQERLDVIRNRIESIFQNLFVRTGSYSFVPPRNIDICVEILVQMAAQE